MPYANPHILATYIQREDNNADTISCPAICEKINTIIQNGFRKKDIDDLKATLLPSHLQGLKTYLRSLDFQHPKKYEKKAKWLIFTEVTETEFLKPLYECIDDLTKDLPKTSKKFDISIPSTQTLLMGALFAAAQVAEAKSPLAGVNQSPFLPKLSSFDDAVLGVCSPFDLLPEYYHILHNTPLPEVTHWFMGEVHTEKYHHQLKRGFIRFIGNPGDHVYFEGEVKGKTFSCEKYGLPTKFHCSGWETSKGKKWLMTELHPHRERFESFERDLKTLHASIDTEWKQLASKGNIVTITLHKILKKMFETLATMWQKYQKQDENLKKIELLTKTAHTVKQLNRLHALYEKSLTKLYHLKEEFEIDYLRVIKQPQFITGRNVGLEETIHEAEAKNSAREQQHKRPIQHFYMSGALHLFPKRAFHNANETYTANPEHFHEIGRNDKQYRLREAASKVPSAMLFPL